MTNTNKCRRQKIKQTRTAGAMPTATSTICSTFIQFNLCKYIRIQMRSFHLNFIIIIFRNKRIAITEVY